MLAYIRFGNEVDHTARLKYRQMYHVYGTLYLNTILLHIRIHIHASQTKGLLCVMYIIVPVIDSDNEWELHRVIIVLHCCIEIMSVSIEG